ncbi:MAG: SsrA-binding protein SmpB [candidate division Zixibacteria bacterium]|nr:SsrA-binding protein SmpB [candidate division Zixibacteria bacterium]
MDKKDENVKVLATNRKARHEYHILEKYEAGLVLTGTEVKSLRQGKVSLADSYGAVKNGEVFLKGMHIAAYSQGNRENHEPTRERKLLLNKREIRKLFIKSEERGFTIIPLKVYFKGSYAKVELAVAKGKHLYDRREDIKKRDAERETRRAKKLNQY